MSSTSDPRAPFALAIETSGMRGAIALGRGAAILATRVLPSLAGHAADLLPALDALCREQRVAPSQIGRVYVSRGPGSFTGLRIGVTVAKMIAFASRAAVVGVPSMEAIAGNALQHDPRPEMLAVLLDAHRGTVYAATFGLHADRYEPIAEPIEADPRSFLSGLPRTCSLTGAGVIVHRAAAEGSGLPILPESLHAPQAEVIYKLGLLRAERGLFDDARLLVPLYIRRAAAEEKWEEKGK